jgi:hypothetical protein
MHKRAIVTAIAGGVIAVTGAFVACSSSSSQPGDAGVDGGKDVGTDLGVTVFETSAPDAGVKDSGKRDTGRRHDGGVKDAAPEAYAIDVGPLAACSAVTGACDIVSQNCSPGSECVIVQGPVSVSTACAPDQPTEHIAQGLPCCPLANNDNPCDPGLECNGGNACTDGGAPALGYPRGWAGARCTPRCCPGDAGNSPANCGTAGDGGAQGYCDLAITYTGNTAAYTVCTYPQTCEPLHVHPCILPGFACEMENAQGTATCTVVSDPGSDGGATSGQPCQYENQCADGLVCVGSTSTNSTCAWMCHINGAPVPFDAGYIQPTVPGYGGCPAGQGCNSLTDFPNWLGYCQ